MRRMRQYPGTPGYCNNLAVLAALAAGIGFILVVAWLLLKRAKNA